MKKEASAVLALVLLLVISFNSMAAWYSFTDNYGKEWFYYFGSLDGENSSATEAGVILNGVKYALDGKGGVSLVSGESALSRAQRMGIYGIAFNVTASKSSSFKVQPYYVIDGKEIKGTVETGFRNSAQPVPTLNPPTDIEIYYQDGKLNYAFKKVENAKSYILRFSGTEVVVIETSGAISAEYKQGMVVNVKAVGRAGYADSRYVYAVVEYRPGSSDAQLSAPGNLSAYYKNGKLHYSFDSVENATSYEISINSYSMVITETSGSIDVPADEFMVVIVVARAEGYLDGKSSILVEVEPEIVVPPLAVPQSLVAYYDGRVIHYSFDAVDNAEFYEITVGGTVITVEETSGVIAMAYEEGMTFSVVAKGGEYPDSPVAVTVVLNGIPEPEEPEEPGMTQLFSPKDVYAYYQNGMVNYIFESVANAESYIVTIGNLEETVISTSGSISVGYEEGMTLSVIARAEGYYDSEASVSKIIFISNEEPEEPVEPEEPKVEQLSSPQGAYAYYMSGMLYYNFESVANAESYEIILGNYEYTFEVQETSGSLSVSGLKDLTVRIIAKANGYKDSEATVITAVGV